MSGLKRGFDDSISAHLGPESKRSKPNPSQDNPGGGKYSRNEFEAPTTEEDEYKARTKTNFSKKQLIKSRNENKICKLSKTVCRISQSRIN